MTEEVLTRTLLNKIRNLNESYNRKSRFKCLTEKVNKLNEAKNPNEAIAITDDPKFGQNVLTNQENQFRAAVDGGAQFKKANEKNVAESPLIYLPAENNLIFSGMIPSLGNLHFQFKLRSNTGYGAWVFIPEGMLLTEKTVETISRIYQFYKNWQEEWNSENADLERMAQHINGD